MARARASRREEIRDRIAYPVIVAVTVMWLVSGGVGLVSGDIRVFAATTPLMGGVIGFAIGVGITRTNGTPRKAEAE